MFCVQLFRIQLKGDLERGFVLDKDRREIYLNLEKAQFLCYMYDKFFVSNIYIEGDRIRVESPVGILYEVHLLNKLFLLKAE